MSIRSLSSCFAFVCLALTMNINAQTIQFTSVPPGFLPDSVTLPQPFAGALAADPADSEIVYAAIGAFDDMSIARVNLATKQVTIVAAGPFGAIAGIAVISPTQIVLIENDGAPASPLPADTVLLAQDNNPADGDFDDPGEITELIAPIQVGMFGFSGTQARIAPAGNAAAIPAGSLVFQTADGSMDAELLVVEDPLGTPAYRPTGGAFYEGFDFNGGFDFDSAGNVYMGTLESAFFTGEIYALINTNADDRITTGEFNALVLGEGGMSDLVIDAEDDVLFAGFNESFAAAIRTFDVPADPLNDSVSVSTFAVTNAGFLSALAITSKSHAFESFAEGQSAALVTSGFTLGFAPATNLAVLRPVPFTAARRWRDYE